MDYQFLEIFQANGQLYAQYIDSSHFTNLKSEYGRCLKLPGQTVCQFFVISDHTIRREVALIFLERLAKGRMVHIHIDLSEMTTTRTYPDGRQVIRK